MQISGSSYTAKGNGNSLSVSVPTADATYNYLKVTEWRCSGNCSPGKSFSFVVSSASNPHVQSTDYDDFVI